MGDIAKTVDLAAQQSDRWLFLAAIVLLGIGALAAIRYLVKTLEVAMRDNKDSREVYHTTIGNMAKEATQVSREVTIVLERNSVVMSESTAELRRCREQRERNHRQ